MLFALPRLIHITRGQAADWLEGIVHFVLVEADDLQPCGALMISRLIDLIVIRALRTWVHNGAASGWLGVGSGLQPRVQGSLRPFTPGRYPSRSTSPIRIARAMGGTPRPCSRPGPWPAQPKAKQSCLILFRAATRRPTVSFPSA
jgi:hypothetical protein